MKKTIQPLLLSGAILAVLLMAACKPAETPETQAPPEPEPTTSAVADVPPATEPAADTMPVEAAPEAAADTMPPATVVGADYPVARDACLAEVAAKTGAPLDQLKAVEVLWAQAGVGVTVQVPGADAPWFCLSNEQGKVQNASYTGSEGKL